MDFYEITLKGMYKLLSDCGEASYADIISECIDRWQSRKDVSFFLNEFSDRGRLRKLRFKDSDFSSEEQNYWTQQMFGGLVAMSIQLADFIRQGKIIDIEFIRQSFGYPSQVINGTACGGCGTKQISLRDIDDYIALPVISDRIKDGLERNALDKNIEDIMKLSVPEINVEREKTRLRAANSDIPVSGGTSLMTFCLSCGSRNIKKCRFLKSIKKNVFVPLSK